MTSVRFNLRRNQKKDPQIQLVYRLDGDAKKAVIGTGLHVPEKYWNKKEMRVRETTKFMDHELYNALLKDWEKAVNEVNKRYLLTKKTVSKHQFKQEVIKEMKGEQFSKSVPSFTEHFENFIQLKKNGSATLGTIKQYQNALNKVNEYRSAKLNGRHLEFDDLTETFIVRFINWLSQTVQQNTIHKIIKKIRTVINHATKRGYNTRMDYKNADCQVSYIKQPKIYLTEDEIQMIRDVQMKPFSRLDKVRDRFLIGLNTGLRYSDFSRLSKDFITRSPKGHPIIELLTVKNKRFVRIPLTSEVRTIFEKYDGYPPSISEVKFNKYLKELCRLAEIKSMVSRNEGGKQVTFEKCDLVSSHTCRRSFATNKFKDGLHPKQLMPITGHSTLQVFMNYICIDEDENIDTLINHPSFQ